MSCISYGGGEVQQFFVQKVLIFEYHANDKLFSKESEVVARIRTQDLSVITLEEVGVCCRS